MSHFYVANSAGSLSCECVGPSSLCQSVLYADSVEGTYRLVVKPTEVGRHTLNILYNGEHVDGMDTDLCMGHLQKRVFRFTIHNARVDATESGQGACVWTGH
jgi:hypothetical protein